jgi:hypothetical protein
MSLQTFKANMLRYMQNQEGIESSDDFAAKLTSEYDLCIKRGFQTINNIPLQKGNTQSMESLAKIACQISLTVQEGNHTFIDDLGKAIVMYWTGATLVTGIPPIIPAVGAISNITTTAASVTKPGQWSAIGPTSPIDDTNIFLDTLLAGIQSHLPTVEFLYSTISMYPSVPAPIVAPGILQSTGYTIPG